MHRQQQQFVPFMLFALVALVAALPQASNPQPQPKRSLLPALLSTVVTNVAAKNNPKVTATINVVTTMLGTARDTGLYDVFKASVVKKEGADAAKYAQMFEHVERLEKQLKAHQTKDLVREQFSEKDLAAYEPYVKMFASEVKAFADVGAKDREAHLKTLALEVMMPKLKDMMAEKIGAEQFAKYDQFVQLFMRLVRDFFEQGGEVDLVQYRKEALVNVQQILFAKWKELLRQLLSEEDFAKYEPYADKFMEKVRLDAEHVGKDLPNYVKEVAADVLLPELQAMLKKELGPEKYPEYEAFVAEFVRMLQAFAKSDGADARTYRATLTAELQKIVLAKLKQLMKKELSPADYTTFEPIAEKIMEKLKLEAAGSNEELLQYLREVTADVMVPRLKNLLTKELSEEDLEKLAVYINVFGEMLQGYVKSDKNAMVNSQQALLAQIQRTIVKKLKAEMRKRLDEEDFQLYEPYADEAIAYIENFVKSNGHTIVEFLKGLSGKVLMQKLKKLGDSVRPVAELFVLKERENDGEYHAQMDGAWGGW